MFWLLVFLIAIFVMAYRRASIRTSALVLVGIIVAFGLVGDTLWLAVLLGLIWIVVYVPLLVPALRQEWLSRAAYNSFRRGLRAIPEDTTTLMETGGAGCAAQLFGGTPDWPTLYALKMQGLSAAQQRLLDSRIDPACSTLAHDGNDTASRNRLFKLVMNLGGTAPKDTPVENDDTPSTQSMDKTGHALRSLACIRAAVALGGRAWPLAAPVRAGWLQLLREEAHDGSARDWLSRAETEFEVLAIASRGLDPERESCGAACIGRAPGNDDGVPGLRLSLRPGVRAGHQAEYYALLVEFTGGSSEQSPRGSTGIVLSHDAPGLKVTPTAGGNVQLTGNAIFVPLSALVGGAHRIGLGVQRLSRAMIEAQAVNAPALRLGGMLPLALASAAYARQHAPFLLPATAQDMVRDLLAETAADLYAGNALREMTLASLSGNTNAATLASIVELQMATLATRIANRLPTHSGALGQLATRPPLPALSALSRVQLGLRAIGRCHPHLRRELEAARQPRSAEALEQFDEAFWAHLGHIQFNAVRSLFSAFTALAIKPGADAEAIIERYQRRIDRASTNLALLVDIALFSLRGRALRNDALVANIGDALAALQRACAVLWKVRQEGADDSKLSLLRVATADAMDTVQNRFDDIIRVLPGTVSRGIARLLVFPLGRWRLPWRAEDHAVATRWLSEGEAARQFSALLPATLPEPALRLRRALEATLAGEPLTSRLPNAEATAASAEERIAAAEKAGHLDSTQASQLREWLFLCDRIEDFVDING